MSDTRAFALLATLGFTLVATVLYHTLSGAL